MSRRGLTSSGQSGRTRPTLALAGRRPGVALPQASAPRSRTTPTRSCGSAPPCRATSVTGMVTAHADHVGSLLRPPELLDARRAHAAGELDHARVQGRRGPRRPRRDRALQEDGRAARSSPTASSAASPSRSELVAAVDGFDGRDDRRVAVGRVALRRARRQDRRAPARAWPSSRPLQQRRGLAAEELVVPARAHRPRSPKITLPSPTLFANLWDPERSRDAYPTLRRLHGGRRRDPRRRGPRARAARLRRTSRSTRRTTRC